MLMSEFSEKCLPDSDNWSKSRKKYDQKAKEVVENTFYGHKLHK